MHGGLAPTAPASSSLLGVHAEACRRSRAAAQEDRLWAREQQVARLQERCERLAGELERGLVEVKRIRLGAGSPNSVLLGEAGQHGESPASQVSTARGSEVGHSSCF